MAFGLGKGSALFRRQLLWLLLVLCHGFLVSPAWPIGMVASLDQHTRTTEPFRPVIPEIGLSLAFPEIPLLKLPANGPRSETEINYHTGYVQIQTYYASRHLSTPLALKVTTFTALRNEGQATEYWRDKTRLSLMKAQSQKHGSGIQWEIVKVPKSVRAILGEGGVGLQVNGYRRIEFSGTSRWDSKAQNTGSYRQSKFPSLDMKQLSRFTVKGNIGSKIYVTVDQDSKRESDLANRIQIRYKGDEDDVLQTVELGNTTLSLPNSRFVGYSQQVQGLFGVKATARLGDLDLTVITSQEKGNSEKARFTAGAKQNVVAIRDYQYLQRTYYDVGRVGGDWAFSPQLGDTIIEFRLYRQGRPAGVGGEAGDPYATMYVDPTDKSAYTSENSATNVREMDPNKDYFIEKNQFWILLEGSRSITENELLACWMMVSRKGKREEIGKLADTLELKLLKSQNVTPNSATWDYEWKNVYSLQATKLNYEEFKLDIFKGLPGSEKDESNLNNQGGIPYLKLFGLDLFNDSGERTSDNKVDNASYLLDLYRGHIVFPHQRTPFNPGDTVFEWNASTGARLEDQVPEIYTEAASQTLRDKSKYYIQITTSRRTETYSLNRVNILDGSETVTLNQRRLTRDVDYRIDYELGQITFLNQDALSPTADLTVDFEYSPFISADKKTLFGMRAEYAKGQDFQIGSSFLYKSQKSTDRQPKLGQEKSRSIVAEMDFAYNAAPRWMTKLADAVPLVETTSQSNFRFSGEVARSMPNPNTQGKVYLDDFEGTKVATDLGHYRENWTKPSPPVNKSDSARARLIWYNPYYDFYITDVYRREVRRAQDARTKVLVLRLSPDSTGSWGGIMRALSSGLRNQSRAQFLEVRLATYGNVQGKLHVDLGEISEDIDGDKVWDCEDREKFDENGERVRMKNRLLDDDEDTGLDSLLSDLEPGYSRDTLPDPSGDDSFYDDDDPENYERINGTEGNAKWDVKGRFPDTEDLDNNEFLDQRNGYFSFAIDLMPNSDYEVAGSRLPATRFLESNPDTLVFRTYRIPLWGGANDPNSSQEGDSGRADMIRYARLWLDGMTAETEVVIATLEIVENRWQKPKPNDKEYVANTAERFIAEVINSEESPDYYTSPPGVAGWYDPRNQVREKEQSLLLRFQDFRDLDTAWVVKQLAQVEDYTGYRYLHMFVHGDTSLAEDIGRLQFVFRMGNSADAYYEQRFALDTGWSPRNEIVFDFDRLTPLKATGRDMIVEDNKHERWSEDGTYRIRGNPTLTQIRYFALGLICEGETGEPLSGEIWVDEMRLSGVRRDQGTAGRLSATMDFADLWSFALNVDHQTYSFRGLTATSAYGQGINLLNGNTQTRYDANTRLSLGKFLPTSWKAQLPVSLKYAKDISVPKLRTGSDIVLTPEMQDDETTMNISHGLTASVSMSPATKNWLAKWTINAVRVSGSMTRRWTWSPRGGGYSQTYTGSGDYGLSFSNRLPVPLLAWTRYLFLPQRVWGSKLYVLPSSFRSSGSISGGRDSTNNSAGGIVLGYNRRFRGQADWTWEPFASLDGSFGFTTERDLYDRSLLKFSLNPHEFKLGRETKFTQKLDLGYTLPFMRFLSPSVSYNANYSEDSDPKRYQDGTRSASVNSRLTAKASLSLRQLVSRRGGKPLGRSGAEGDKGKEKDKDKDKEPEKGKAPPPESEALPDSLKAQEETEKEQEKAPGGGFRPYAPVIWLLRLATSPFEPISATYSRNETKSEFQLEARPSLIYRFGLASKHGVPKLGTGSVGTYRDSKSLADAYGLNSAISLFGLLKVSTGYEYSRATNQSTSSTRKTSETFPRLSTQLAQLGKIKFLSMLKPMRWLLDNSSAKLDYSQSSDWTEKPDTAGGWEKDNKNTSEKWGSSLRFGYNFRSGWKIGTGYSWAKTDDEQNSFNPKRYSSTRRYTSGIDFSTDYSLRAPNGVRFPFLRRMRLKSTLNLNLAIKYSSTRTEATDKEEGNYTPTAHQTTLSIEPRANYSFSSTMKGGFQLSWRDTTDKATDRTNSVRQVSIWLEFSF